MRQHPAAVLCALLSAAILGLAPASVGAAAPSGSGSTSVAGTSAPETRTNSGSTPGATTQKATFGLQPATKGKPDARPFLSYQSSPGGTFRDTVSLLNFGSIPLELQVYLSNLSNAADGTLAVAAENTPRSDAATWTQMSGVAQSVHVAAGTSGGPSQLLIPVSLAVPIDAAPGDHVAALVASLQTIGKNPKGENVRLLQRVALRIYVRVNGDIHAHYVVQGLKIAYRGTPNPFGPGSADVTYAIRNDGNVSVGVSQRVKVSGWFGSTGSSRAVGDIPVLLPGGTVRVRVHVDNVWPEVRLRAKVTTAPIRTSTSTDSLIPAMSSSAATWAIPWALLVVLVLLIALGVALRLWTRSGRRSYSGRRRN